MKYCYFSDGVNKFRVSKSTGQPLPNPRFISNVISSVLGQQFNNKKLEDDTVNANFVFFAQFLDHDLTNTFPKPITPNTPIFGQIGTGICCGNGTTQFGGGTYIPPTPLSRLACISIK